jgi:hypothetical protein
VGEVGAVKRTSRFCSEKRETRPTPWSESASRSRMQNRKGESKTGRIEKSEHGPTKAKSRIKKENLKIWVGQTRTGQNLGGCRRFRMGHSLGEYISEKPECRFRIQESPRPRWASIQNSNDITRFWGSDHQITDSGV